MMDLLDTMPVTIIVKAPSQKIQDLIVQGELEWTVERLKQHLSNVYPNNPVSTCLVDSSSSQSELNTFFKAQFLNLLW